MNEDLLCAKLSEAYRLVQTKLACIESYRPIELLGCALICIPDTHGIFSGGEEEKRMRG